METGDRSYLGVEFVNRYPLYAAARKAGLTPAQAKALVNKSQFDYAAKNYSRFENSIAKRLVPFYGWLSNNLPYQIKTLINNPGGATPYLLRKLAKVQGNGEYLPQWLEERMGVRLGGDEDNATVIRSFGLPIEDLGDIPFSGGLPNLNRVGQRLISRMAPGVTLAWRLFTGRDPVTGREIKDMKGPTGNPQLDTVLASAPTARLQSSIMDITKPDKQLWAILMNQLTGVKVGNYDLQQARDRELRDMLAKELAAMPDVGTREVFYPQQKDLMEPERRAQVTKNIRTAEMLNRALKAARQRRILELQEAGG